MTVHLIDRLYECVHAIILHVVVHGSEGGAWRDDAHLSGDIKVSVKDRKGNQERVKGGVKR